jgi:2-hydroxychromene-2-carboxylate isomerase
MKVSWVFDVVSPYAYLAFKRLSRFPETTAVEYVPVLFARLLSHFGQLGPAEIAPKRRFTYRFALWRARQLGISMHWPEAHPFNPLTAQRMIIAAGSSLPVRRNRFRCHSWRGAQYSGFGGTQ